MREIVITQKNFDGSGNDRVFRERVKRDAVEVRLRRIERAYNMDNTEVTVL